MLQAQTTPTDVPTGPFFGDSANATHVSHCKSDVKVGTLTARQLREHGSTKRMMERFLVKPDGYAQNPHVKAGRPMRLYRTDRVQAAASHDDFTG